jgi:NhaP-type Na+/H+ and K+/H+ antiporter
MDEDIETSQRPAAAELKDAFRTFNLIARWNLKYLRTNTLGEISGSLGDLGTLLPILIALAQSGAIDLSTTLVVTGIASIVAGTWFGYPLAVQPMKAIAGIVLSHGMGLHENMSAGLTTGAIVAVVSVVGIEKLLKMIPLPVVRGMSF